MTLLEIYQLAVKMGTEADPRGKDGIKRYLDRQKKIYADLAKSKKDDFDVESLTNPYTDTRILVGDLKTPIKRVMAGIDSNGAEILLADRLSEKGKKIDAVIAHHPAGHALASLHEVMDLQLDTFADNGVPENVAHALLQESINFVKRRFGPLNHSQAVDAAKLLGIPLLALHTVWDNMGDKFMKDYMKGKKFDRLSEVLDYICEIPEFKEAQKGKNGPSIVSGGENSRPGKIMVTFTGGTNVQKELYQELAKAGVGTLIEMHIPEDSLQELKKAHINAIDVGHMAADSIGANLYLDELEKKGIDVIPASGLIRVKRFKASKTSRK